MNSDNKDMIEFASNWCDKYKLDINNLTDEQINKLCHNWASHSVFKEFNIEFKTIEQLKKEGYNIE